MSPREDVARQFRLAMQLGSCDPRDCQLCDCNMDDEGRAQIESLAYQQADVAVAAVVAACIAATLKEMSTLEQFARIKPYAKMRVLAALREVQP